MFCRSDINKDQIDKNSVIRFLESKGYRDILSLTNEGPKFIFSAINNKGERIAVKISWSNDNGVNEREVSEILPNYKYLNTPKFINRYENEVLMMKDGSYDVCTFDIFELPLMDCSFIQYQQEVTRGI